MDETFLAPSGEGLSGEESGDGKGAALYLAALYRQVDIGAEL